MGTHWCRTLLSLLLAAVMTVSLLPVTALAEETADTRKVITRVEGKSYHLGSSGYDAPSYGWPNDFKSRPEVEITKIFFADGTALDTPTRDDIHTHDGSGAKNWERKAADGSWEDYGMTAYPKFIEGTYRYVVKLGVDYNKYRFANDADIQITDAYHGGEVWTQDESVFETQWYIISPDYTVESAGYLIDNTRIEDKQLSIGATRVGKAITIIDLNSSVMGGTKPYRFEKAAGSPDWINVSPEGIVSGTPTAATAAPTELKVTVTDSGTPAKTVTLTIPVERTFPTDDERTKLAYAQVDLKDILPAWNASTDLFPGFTLRKAVDKEGHEIENIPDKAIVFYHGMGNNGCWLKWNEETEKWEGYYKTTFDLGTYRFDVMLRLQNTGASAFGEQHIFAKDFNVQMYKNGTLLIGENAWEVQNVRNFDVYSTVELLSPPYTVEDVSRDLTGNVEITCTVRTGDPISTHVSTDIPEGNLRYQWQKQSAADGSWSNWGPLTASGTMSGNRVEADKPGPFGTGAVRVIVSAVGYEGTLVSTARPINPAIHTEAPAIPKVRYLSNGVLFVTNPIGYKQQDYLLSETPMTQEQLDTAPERTTETGAAVLGRWTNAGDVSVVSSENVFKVDPNKLYYVYTRITGGHGYLTGKEYCYKTIYTGDAGGDIYLSRLVLDGYTSYGVGNTIYVPIGESVTINLKKEPENANTWNVFEIKSPSPETAFSVSADPGTIVSPGGAINTITITGNTLGGGKIGAYYGSGTGTYYGEWSVTVYDPADITRFDVLKAPAYADVTLENGKTYDPTGGTPVSITTNPDNALDGYELKWYARVATGAGGVPVFITSDESQKNEFISVDENTGVVTAHQVHGEGNDIYKQVALFAIKGNTKRYITGYSVTVEAAAEPEGALLVNPGSLSIAKGETASLTAQAVGLPTGASGGVFKWTITGFATVTPVGGNGNEAEVKANSHGNSTVKVTYTYTVNGESKVLSATVPVSVHQWGDWEKLDESTHWRSCEKCSEVETENHYPTVEGGSSILPAEGGKTVWKCNACGYTWDNGAYHTVALDANGGTVTPDYALVSDVGRIGFLPTPERSGYSFSGWYTEKTGGTKVTESSVIDTAVTKLYAQWSANGGSSGGTTTIKPVQSPSTGDPGIMLCAAMGLLSLTGGAWTVGRKRRDK